MSDLNYLQKKNLKAIPENIRQCQEAFSNLKELLLNVPRSISLEIKNFLERQTEWVELICTNHYPIEEYINEKYCSLLKWLLDWKEVETKDRGANQEHLQLLPNILSRIKIGIISAMLYKNNQQLTHDLEANLNTTKSNLKNTISELEAFTQIRFNSCENFKFEDLVKLAKKEYFILDGWNRQGSHAFK